MQYNVPLIADNMYHLFSRANGNEKLFIESRDYNSFLKRFDEHISPVADTFAYSLLPNHFHFQVQIKSFDQLLEVYRKQQPARSAKPDNFKGSDGGWQPKFTMQQFSNMLNGYTKSFNAKYNRKGSLFMDSMRRVEIKSDPQYTATLFYIHKNPVHHGYCKNISRCCRIAS